ncbi:MAG: hypothetical protein ACK5LC_06705 [Coprobacillaceae bacterium]
MVFLRNDDIGGGATALFDSETGNLTELGELYKSLGNPDVIESDDVYIIDQAYYKDLDNTIQIAKDIKTSDNYHLYMDVISFEEVLQKAIEIDRNLFIIDQNKIHLVNEDLKNEIENLVMKVNKEVVIDDLNNNDIVNSNNSIVKTGDYYSIQQYFILGVVSLRYILRYKKQYD